MKIEIEQESDQVFKVLDVGSCHNPLKTILVNNKSFDITAIDLTPATSDVLCGELIQIPVGNDLFLDPNKTEVKCLPQNYYDSVIFCLLLEYLPSPKLRLIAVKKGIEVLKPFGILIIVTPGTLFQRPDWNWILKTYWRFHCYLRITKIVLKFGHTVKVLGDLRMTQRKLNNLVFSCIYTLEGDLIKVR